MQRLRFRAPGTRDDRTADDLSRLLLRADGMPPGAELERMRRTIRNLQIRLKLLKWAGSFELQRPT